VYGISHTYLNKPEKKILGILEDKESEFVCPHVRANKGQNSTKTK
jgi:hypothetical protein